MTLLKYNEADVEGIILAAGFSSRAGSFKMEWLLAGKPLIRHAIEGMADFCSRIIVVGGYSLERLIALTREYEKVQVVFNKEYSSGMFSSVKEGIKHLQGRKFFLTPADCPLVKEEVYRALMQAQQDIAVPRYRGKKGHPIIMSSSLAPEILSEPDDSNLGNFIRRKGCETIDVEDENILLDIDTKEDYEKIKNLLDDAI